MAVEFEVQRVRMDEAGETSFDAYKVQQTLKDFAPPARPFFVSDVERATGYVMIHLPVGWVGEPHPSPRRQIVFCLSGSLTITTSDGDSRSFEAGGAYLLEDTSGKGHKSEVTSDIPVSAVIVQLPETG
jgi:quercetin dioxygenase-like cupin family protein